MTTVEFFDLNKNPVGVITVTATGELRADPWLQSVANAWTANRRSVADFDGWSNGHMVARVRPERGTRATLGAGARFKALSKKLR